MYAHIVSINEVYNEYWEQNWVFIQEQNDVGMNFYI
jgi:hypothetical protein